MTRGPAGPTAMVALLRGVNVGGRNKLAMADLRRITGACGYTDVATYVQSGNVVFCAPDGDADAVAGALAAAITVGTGLEPAVTVRTASEMAAIVTANPFGDRTDDPTKVHVVFRCGATAEVDWYSPDAYAPEVLAVAHGEIYLYLPNGIGRSRLAADLTRRSARAGTAGTARNWRSVLSLAEMADGLEC